MTAPQAWRGNINPKRRLGAICEAIATEHFFRAGYFVLHPWFGVGPVDLICIKTNPVEVLFLDVKAEARRETDGTRIHRVLTPHQRRLGVRLCYVNPETRQVHLVQHRDLAD